MDSLPASRLSSSLARLDELVAAEIDDKVDERFAILKKRKADRDTELAMNEAAEKHARSNKLAAARMHKLRAKPPTPTVSAADATGKEPVGYLRTADARIEAANKRAAAAEAELAAFADEFAVAKANTATAEAELEAYKNVVLEEEVDAPGNKGYAGEGESEEGAEGEGMEE